MLIAALLIVAAGVCTLQVYALVVQGRMRDACKLLENHSERRNKKGRDVSSSSFYLRNVKHFCSV